MNEVWQSVALLQIVPGHPTVGALTLLRPVLS